jgi:sporulation protein YlmC with PRC-barrel domain
MTVFTRSRAAVAALALASVVSFAAVSQAQSLAPRDASSPARVGTSAAVMDKGALVGKPVFTSDGEKVGEIADVIQVNGAPRLVSIAHGGVLGIGERYAEVDVRSISASADGVVVKMTAPQLAALPDVGAPMEEFN